MARANRVSTISALIVCLGVTQSNGVLFASEPQPAEPTAAASQPVATIELLSDPASIPAPSPFALSSSALGSNPLLSTLFVPTAFDAFAQRGGPRGGRGRDRDRGDRGRGAATGGHGPAAAALVLGAVASITGAAILVYANRPECSINVYRADGCGYGTKVVGGAALSLGVVGFSIAAITW